MQVFVEKAVLKAKNNLEFPTSVGVVHVRSRFGHRFGATLGAVTRGCKTFNVINGVILDI